MADNFIAANDDRIEVGDVLNITGDKVTLSTWARIASKTDEMKMLAKWSDSPAAFSYLLSTDAVGNDKALFAVNASSQVATSGTTAMVIGQWHHVAGVYDGSDIRVYLDGAEENSTALTGNISSNTAPVRIGMGSGAVGEEPMDGDLGHCAIWDRALTPGEIKSLSEGISPLQIRSNLLFYAPLNGQDPEYDVIGGLDLTVTGATKAEEPPIPNSIVAP